MKTLLYIKMFFVGTFKHFFRRKNPKHGNFIVIDGGEGAGKDTVIERLKAKYPHVVFSREPGGTEYAEEIRSVMLSSKHAKEASGTTQLLLVMAGRSDHMEKKIEPAVFSGRHAVSNRGPITSFGYQIGGQEGGYELAKIFFQVHNFILKKAVPDLNVILEVDPDEGARRVALRKGEVNHFDLRKRDFHVRVMKAYRTFGRIYPWNTRFVDANKSRDEVFAAVDALVGPLLSE